MTQYTPNMLLPYPEMSDAPRGAEQIQALAEAIDDGATPVWKSVAFANTSVITSNTALWAYNAGKIIFAGRLGGTSIATGATVMTLPTALKPARSLVRIPLALTTTTAAPPLARADLTASTGTVTVTIGTGATFGSVYLDGLVFEAGDPVAALAYYQAQATPSAADLLELDKQLAEAAREEF